MTVLPAPTGCAIRPPRGSGGESSSFSKRPSFACVFAATADVRAASTARAAPKRPARRSPFAAAAAAASASTPRSPSSPVFVSRPEGNSERPPKRTGSASRRDAPQSSSPSAPRSTDAIQRTVRAWCGNKPAAFRTRLLVSVSGSSNASLAEESRSASRSRVLGDGAAVGPSTNARSRSSAGGSAWSNTSRFRITGSSACRPTVTSTRAPTSESSGTTKHRRCPRPRDANPCKLNALLTSASTSNRRPSTNQSSFSRINDVSCARSAPGATQGAGTTVACPASRRHTRVAAFV